MAIRPRESLSLTGPSLFDIYVRRGSIDRNRDVGGKRGSEMSLTTGLEYKKIDLHVHTPESTDHKEKHITADQIVKRAIGQDLAAIAITDHQTGAFIDKVKAAALGTGLIVFPGVEIMCSGGKFGIHLICLFDTDNDTAHVEQFLNTIKIYERRGERTLCADLTPGGVADALMEYDSSAILLLAHSHSTKGVLGDMQGEQRTQVFDPRRTCLLAAETSAHNFTDAAKKTRHNRVIDVLDGSDPNYCKRKLGVYQSSDAHTLEEIGSEYSYFKVDDNLTLEDIRQALIDRDTRIRQPHEFVEGSYPRIDSISLTSGFLENQSIPFHMGLNSLLGAKGSGKSLVVEFLRFAFCQPPSNQDLLRDHNSKLESCLGLYGEVVVDYTDDSGKRYRVVRSYKPSDGNPTTVIDIAEGAAVSFHVDDVFPVLFLSQNEVIKIAEDPTKELQRQFIDQFLDFKEHYAEISRSDKDLKTVDRSLSESLRLHLSGTEIKQRKAVIVEGIEKLDRQLKDEIFTKYSAAERVGLALSNQSEFIEVQVGYLTKVASYYSKLGDPIETDDKSASHAAVKRGLDKCRLAVQKINEGISATIKEITNLRQDIESEIAKWKTTFAPIKNEYDEHVKAAGGDIAALSEHRKSLQKQLTAVDKELANHAANESVLNQLGKERNSILARLDQTRKAFFEERSKRCADFTAHSREKLHVSMAESKDTTDFKENLLKLRRGTYLREDDIETLATAVTPALLVRSLLLYAWFGRDSKQGIPLVATPTNLPVDKLRKLYDFLLDEYEFEDLFALVYTSVPKDVPTISYKVGTKYKALDQLSVGQKASALLLMALSAGQFPIVIDQPEDSLDLSTIWEDVCTQLRLAKDNRQFILTTHNSSVAVASDSDKFTILRFESDHGSVFHTGSINDSDVKMQVIDYLEGGPTTYEHKRKKYNL